jgi:hypothetical protein
VERINLLQDKLQEAHTSAANFNEREKVFGFPPTEYPQLLSVEQDLQPFYSLWNMISEFHTSQQVRHRAAWGAGRCAPSPRAAGTRHHASTRTKARF